MCGELSREDERLANRILDKLMAGEAVCYLDFPEVDEQRFNGVMEWTMRTMARNEIHRGVYANGKKVLERTLVRR